MAKMKVAQIVMECLLEQGVDTVFGYPGGTILNIYDELYRYRDKINHVLTAHEQGASHAADGYARATGKVGVCFVTSGPGATNLTTGIATAYMDSSPVVFITCNVEEPMIGRDSFQEVDITGITMPITKSNYLVRDKDTVADTIREAFTIASSGRPGPVLIDILKNVTAEEAEYTPLPKAEHIYHGKLARLARISETNEIMRPEVDMKDVEILAEMIKESKRPMVICGGGVIRDNACEEFTKFVEIVNAPTACSLMGIGGIPGEHPLYTGMIGMHGSHASNVLSDECDLLISVGCRFSNRIAGKADDFAKNAKVVHIDIDRAEINKNIICEHYIIGRAKEVLQRLNEKTEQKDNAEWLEIVEREKAFEAPYESRKLDPKDILGAIYDKTDGQAIIVTDVGQHQMWSAQHYKYSRAGQLITSGGFGTMGFGLGAAMGAKVGNPDCVVVHIAGDGCFRMNCHELCTVEQYNIPVISVVFNNGVLGMVRQWQTLIYGGRYSETTLDRGPDFVKLADAYGVQGHRAETMDEFTAAFDKALKSGKPAVIDCMIDMDEMVRPMVAGGNPLTTFMLD